MIHAEVIIVGGGPAGSTCAWRLKQHGVDCIIVDKKTFPRPKVCAGWITPRVVRDLKLDPARYPHSLVSFRKLYFHFPGLRVPLKTYQYSIRRIEFDHWLLERSGVPVHHHVVKEIRQLDNHYILDERFSGHFLVGAGGTHCPVYRTLFQPVNPRADELLVTAMEDEFRYDYRDPNCYLWFFARNLPGYAWYVPKGNGYLNVGLGGTFSKLKRRRINLRRHWEDFTAQLDTLDLVRRETRGTRKTYSPRGYSYYLRQKVDVAQRGRAFIIGDSAGLATRDLGEGIGPAVESALLAAEAIIHGGKYSPREVTRWSTGGLLRAGFKAP